MNFGVHFGHWGPYYEQLGVETCLRQAHEAKAEVYEFFPTPAMFALQKAEIRKLRDLLEQLQIEPVFTFGYPKGMDVSGDDEALRNQAIAYINNALAGMGMLGARTIGGIVYANWPAAYDNIIIQPEDKKRRFAHCVDSLRKIVPVAADHGITVNLEIVNRFEHFLLNTVQEGMDMCDAVGHPNCKLLLDCFHMNIEEDDIPASIRKARGYIGHFHVSEPNRKVPNRITHVNWVDVGKALHAAGYDKAVIVESFYRFGGRQGHNMRMWRNLDDDLSVENLVEIAKSGIAYIKTCFTEGGAA